MCRSLNVPSLSLTLTLEISDIISVARKNGKEKLQGKTSFTSNCSRVIISENIPLVQNILDYHVKSAIYLFWAILQYCKRYLYNFKLILE